MKKKLYKKKKKNKEKMKSRMDGSSPPLVGNHSHGIYFDIFVAKVSGFNGDF
jgi:hypothetical protein